MRTPAIVLMLVGMVMLGTSACNKYDEGPAFSLRSKTSRATNHWVVDIAQKNGIDITNEVRISANLKSDGTITFRDTLATLDGDTITLLKGVWEFDQSGENLIFVFTNPGGGAIGAKLWYILRLTNDELWVTETVGEDLYRYQFIPK